MADRLTQLQDCLDDLLTQMYASLNYIYHRHPYGEIPGQPSQAPSQPTANGTAPAANGDTQQSAADTAQNGTREASLPPPEPPNVFNASLHELAQDLVLKEAQIEFIIKSLPGIGSSEADQERRLRELELELRQVEQERARKEIGKRKMVDLLGEVISKVKRVP